MALSWEGERGSSHREESPAGLIGPVNPRASVQARVSDYSVCRVHGLNHLELNKAREKGKKEKSRQQLWWAGILWAPQDGFN